VSELAGFEAFFFKMAPTLTCLAVVLAIKFFFLFVFAAHEAGNAQDCAVGAFIGLHGQKSD
jgi:hypothetical protein